MQFERNREVFDTLDLGERNFLDTVSLIEISFLEADFGRWERGTVFYGTSKGIGRFEISNPDMGEVIMSEFEKGYFSRSWIRDFFKLKTSDVKRITHISFSFKIKPEYQTGFCEGRCYGKMIWEYNRKVYDIPETIFLIDDLDAIRKRKRSKRGFRNWRKS